MESPPKRITRSRSAKVGEPTTKPTKIITAAARAKAAPSTALSSTSDAGTKSVVSTKRKTRADENDNDNDVDEIPHEAEVPARRARGRPRKAVEPETETAAAPASRGRAAKKAATEESAPAKAPRGRPRKVVVDTAPADDEPEAGASKKATRGRAGTASKSGGATAKKTVTFQEPDKENLEPARPKAKGAAPTASIRGRPARRGGATAARSSRPAAKTEATAQKKPLSPKKVTQMPLSRDRDSSEDELAGTDFTPVKPLMKSPVKPPGRSMAGTKKSEPQEEVVGEEDTTQEVNAAVLNSDESSEDIGLGSPAKRPPQSPFKDSMKSPAKRTGAIPFPSSAVKSASRPTQPGQATPLKGSLLTSPAKRPQSPIKGLNFGSTLRGDHSQSAMKSSMLQSPAKRALPGLKPWMEPRQRDAEAVAGSPTMKPLVAATPANAKTGRPSEKLMMEENDQGEDAADADDVFFSRPIENLSFPGRMSAVVPRHADPLVNDEVELVEEQMEQVQVLQDVPPVAEGERLLDETADAETAEGMSSPTPLDEAVADTEDNSVTPPQTPPMAAKPMFQLRQKDLDPFHGIDSESEDELASPIKTFSFSPSPRKSRRTTLGLSSLTDQFGAWSAASPAKAKPVADVAEATNVEQTTELVEVEATAAVAEESPAANSFFEEEMSARLDFSPEKIDSAPKDLALPALDEPEFADLAVTNEDMALAEEANEMSLMEPEQVQQVVNPTSFEDDVSEDSQEYGDENQMPIDPALLHGDRQVMMTPVRPLVRNFNTTTKIPLKPADESTPSPLKKRSLSASRVPRRPKMPMRNATVISYSPTKDRGASFTPDPQEDLLSSAPATPTPVTPAKSEVWSTMGTPARTPRKDIDPALLQGAIVFVDVHTSEGAVASGIFVELLTAMGARCLKSWPWNPSSPTNGEPASNRVGITHVVYKDGGKRTLEKVREANGVVQCVGVSWVLDCERENRWLDEASYYIDTSLIPRGGARRRKSMEPKALANLNGTLVSSPSKGDVYRDIGTALTTPRNRRDSTVWMHTPSDQGEEEEADDDIEWSKFILTPVPKTPAPEALAQYAANVPETPSGNGDMDSESTGRMDLMMRTCPPKPNTFEDMGAGILSSEKDEQVLMRLMAARRKSLQFAPKIGSPLSKTWD